MWGAIIGDIVGSRFEHRNYRQKDFALFSLHSYFTDDTLMTLAVAKALCKCGRAPDIALYNETIRCMRVMGTKYPYAGWGSSFERWLKAKNPQPYQSFGNGAAMRISAVGFAARSRNEVKTLSRAVTAISHDHPEGLKGAESVAMAIFLARQSKSKAEIRDYIEQNYYKIGFTLDEIRGTYEFNETCQNTVPQAFEAFFEAKDFEDAIRNAISIGGDSDTLAAITGGIAETYFGVPFDLRKKAERYLENDTFRPIYTWLKRFEKMFP